MAIHPLWFLIFICIFFANYAFFFFYFLFKDPHYKLTLLASQSLIAVVIYFFVAWFAIFIFFSVWILINGILYLIPFYKKEANFNFPSDLIFGGEIFEYYFLCVILISMMPVNLFLYNFFQ